MWAAFNGHEETVRILLKCGADIALRDDMGRTALMYSSTAPSPGTVRLLLDAGADVNQRDTDEGFTALMFAAAEGNDEVVKLLLDAGADSGLKDVDGDTALDFATKRGQLKTIEILNARAAPSASLSESAQERDGSDAGEVEAEAPEAVAPPASLPSH
jgi:ankyrin repeat protein